MTRPNKNPLDPASLEANGNQGADANARRVGDGQHNPTAMSAAILAHAAMGAARAQLDRYALATDEPAPGVPEAADFIDLAIESMLRGAP